EMIEFPNGVFGLALNLEETEVGAILLGDNTLVAEGDEAKTTGKLLQVPVGKALLGRVVNTLGQQRDNKGPIKTVSFKPSARRTQTSRARLPFWKKKGRCRTRRSFPRRRQTPRLTSISRRLPVPLWASGSWITVWMR